MHLTWDHERPPTKFETNPTTFNFPLAGHPRQAAGEAALAICEVPAGPLPLPALAGEKRSPQNFFISWTICTIFGTHVTWDHGRPPIKYETNPTTFNFPLARHLGQGAGEAALAGKRLSARPGEKLCTPRKFFISWTICTKFGMHLTWDHERPPTKFETNPTTLAGHPGQGAGEAALARRPAIRSSLPAHGRRVPARGITESPKLFHFLDYLHQIWHARHLGPWATALQIWDESDNF